MLPSSIVTGIETVKVRIGSLEELHHLGIKTNCVSQLFPKTEKQLHNGDRVGTFVPLLLQID